MIRRVHRKVWLAWGRWWAVQLVLQEPLQLGVRLEPRRPLLDLFVGPVTVALGNHPVLRDARHSQRHSFPGFIVGEHPGEAVL